MRTRRKGRWLPKQPRLGARMCQGTFFFIYREDEIKNTIQAVLNELGIAEPSARDKGKVMKELMPRVKGRADGSLVNRIVGELLK